MHHHDQITYVVIIGIIVTIFWDLLLCCFYFYELKNNHYVDKSAGKNKNVPCRWSKKSSTDSGIYWCRCRYQYCIMEKSIYWYVDGYSHEHTWNKYFAMIWRCWKICLTIIVKIVKLNWKCIDLLIYNLSYFHTHKIRRWQKLQMFQERWGVPSIRNQQIQMYKS